MFNWLDVLRQQLQAVLPQRKLNHGNRMRCTTLRLEVLEARCVPTAVPSLVWNGPAGGKWSVAANWNTMNGVVSTVTPTNGFVVTFDPAKKDTNSEDDIGNLQLERLVVLAGSHRISPSITPLSTNSSATIAGGKLIQAMQGTLEFGIATATTSTISLSNTTIKNLQVIIDTGMATGSQNHWRPDT